MDGRESIALSGSSSYYLHRGFSGSASTHNGLHAPPSFSSPTNPNLSVQSNVRDSSPVGPTFPVENTSPSFPHGLNMGMPMGQPAKKKRGRPRKYGPDGTNMSLGLSPMSAPGSMTPTPKRARGRPPGSGRKQQLASLVRQDSLLHLMSSTSQKGRKGGHWGSDNDAVNDIASRIMSFSEQRPRALCILSANGAVSSATLRQPTSSSSTVMYKGQFQILCLSGSFLVADNGGPRSRTGSLSVSLCSSDGYVVGGGVGGMLIAGGPVQVVVCSFAYGGSKSKNKTDVGPNGEQSSVLQPSEEAGPPASPPRRQNLTPISSSDVWPNLRNLQTEIDLTPQKCKPSGKIKGKKPTKDKCNTDDGAECCKEGKFYTTYKCSPSVSGRTKTTLTINNFEKGRDGGAPSECDGEYHSNNMPVVALSTGWFNKLKRCHKSITIHANGRSVGG
ncbi:hypothetical protein TEA_010562 [Camellia sinensis var. sinensis]|uniref:AT-hook motif nuclear-localized protein n=1 Tax=Camellia sinensis var. sinensis TaxID=542762 RepID=A0A4S4EJ05_CAMSN|nr:hypothetical protein TEA_010562 [Camellia sinensis var. sinensis]